MNNDHDDIEETLLADTLGLNQVVSTTAERYAGLRRQSSENLVTVLAAQDSEYARRQGKRNFEVLTSAVSQLPLHASLSYQADRDQYKTFWSVTVSKNYFSDIEIALVVEESDVESIDAETVDALNTFRATAVWIERPVEDVCTLPDEYSREFERSSNKTKQDEVMVPHVIVGHRPVENGKFVEVLLVPFVFKTQKEAERSARDSWHYSPSEKVQSKPLAPISARMTEEAYSRLIATQDSLIGEGLSAQEIKQIHDSEKGTFTVHPSTIATVKASLVRSSLGMAMARPPRDHKDLEEDFDLRLTDTLKGETIHPNEFASYHIMEDLFRLFAMLGSSDDYEKVKNDFMRGSLSDPAIKLLNTSEPSAQKAH